MGLFSKIKQNRNERSAFKKAEDSAKFTKEDLDSIKDYAIKKGIIDLIYLLEDAHKKHQISDEKYEYYLKEIKKGLDHTDDYVINLGLIEAWIKSDIELYEFMNEETMILFDELVNYGNLNAIEDDIKSDYRTRGYFRAIYQSCYEKINDPNVLSDNIELKSQILEKLEFVISSVDEKKVDDRFAMSLLALYEAELYNTVFHGTLNQALDAIDKCPATYNEIAHLIYKINSSNMYSTRKEELLKVLLEKKEELREKKYGKSNEVSTGERPL